MESSSLNKGLYDTHRKKWIKDRPEEKIRLSLLHHMVNDLSYPLGLIALEKSLQALPHLCEGERKRVPNRRVDIVVFAKKIHRDFPLFPLLLIECKAVALTAASFNQVIGYNDIVRAPFLALSNGESLMTGYHDGSQYQFIEGLYSYPALLDKLTNRKES